ncbi:MAG: FUN14 domain-containing protein [Methylobacter sp.]|nr:FUN14 domain-containing protein [Methylobacter sp.]MDP2098323.1 FUN14 domain-containing protein [Methylobacter sp.]MDP2429131.1 FUN14 domain-containing protein [Methylobacter sp.]MDP3055606.1 FUN14 domain-containing protein [Methylobacter sp.]MDP3361952.1 FUN14 domain-containing protein [Methylobacter sp.]
MNIQPADTVPSTDIFSSGFLLGNVGAPFVIGLAVGYFAKKMLRMALFLGGGLIVMLFVAESYDVIDITDEKLQYAASAATDVAKKSSGFLVDRLTRITSQGASGVGGFFCGFKMG